MAEWTEALMVLDPVSIVVLLLLIGSMLQGMMRGASGSAKRLFYFIWEGVCILVSLTAAAWAAAWLSPELQLWLTGRDIKIPQQEIGAFRQLWYTLVTGLRDFSVFRFGVLFLVLYMLLRFILGWLTPLITLLGFRPEASRAPGNMKGAASRLAGACIGIVHGVGRSLVLIAMLFIYVTMAPNGVMSEDIGRSPLYRQASATLIEPVAGQVIAKHGPVITRAVEDEFRLILQRKYEIIDYAVPQEIEQAAVHITKDKETDEEKARALYDWVGTRITYDWDKVRNYEERGIWKEQTPQQTFETRKGVCIDVARLYAMMARSAGLEVRVVTGMGADGRGGYGPHAWNEVLLSEREEWIPLDATWASSGDWFNPPNFDKTHIREA